MIPVISTRKYRDISLFEIFQYLLISLVKAPNYQDKTHTKLVMLQASVLHLDAKVCMVQVG